MPNRKDNNQTLPSLRQRRGSDGIFSPRESDNLLTQAIKELSDSLTLLREGQTPAEEIRNSLSGISKFIDTANLDTSDMEKSLSSMYQSLFDLQMQNREFIKNSVETNKYLSNMDKAAFAEELRASESEKQMEALKQEIKAQSSSTQLYIKSISLLKNGITGAEEISKRDRKALLKKLEDIGASFNSEGKVRSAELLSVVKEIQSIKDEDGNQAVDIESESTLVKALEQSLYKEVVDRGLETGSLDTASLVKDSTNLLISDLVGTLDNNSQMQIEALTSSIATSKISESEGLTALKEIFQENNALSESTVTALNQLSEYLSIIRDNTDPEENKLTNAEKISRRKKEERDEEANDKLLETLSRISDAGERPEVRTSILDGVSDAESAGEALSESALDWIFGSNGGGKGKKGGKAPKGGLLSAGKKVGSTLGKVGSVAGKVAGPLATAAAVGMSAYDFFTADDTAERNKSAGSGIGSVVGGVLGSALGPVGTVAGAALGNWLGGKIGSWFTNIQDNIPDEVKKKGPEAEIGFIDDILLPQVKAEVMSGQGTYNEDDIKDLLAYKKKLVDAQAAKQAKIDAMEAAANEPPPTVDSAGKPVEEEKGGFWSKALSGAATVALGPLGLLKDTAVGSWVGDKVKSGVSSVMGEDSEITKLVSQGLTNPMMIAAALGKPLKDVASFFTDSNKSGGMAQASGDIDISDLEKRAEENSKPSAPIVVNNISNNNSSGDSESARVTDESLILLSHMV